jgi:hypothetical protein
MSNEKEIVQEAIDKGRRKDAKNAIKDHAIGLLRLHTGSYNDDDGEAWNLGHVVFDGKALRYATDVEGLVVTQRLVERVEVLERAHSPFADVTSVDPKTGERLWRVRYSSVVSTEWARERGVDVTLDDVHDVVPDVVPEPVPASSDPLSLAIIEIVKRHVGDLTDVDRVIEIVKEHGVDEERIRTLVDTYVSKRPPLTFTVPSIDLDGDLPAIRHERFDEILGLCLRFPERDYPNVWLVGPAGTGKTMLAAGIAKALKRGYFGVSLSEGTAEHDLFGRFLPQKDGSIEHCLAQFAIAYRDGYVILIDEIDAGDANVLVAVNSALANGHLFIPGHGLVDRHPETVIIAAANTYGTGPSGQYVRNMIDAATRDRFVGRTVEVDYSPAIETSIAAVYGDAGTDALSFVWGIRAAILDPAKGLKGRIVSTRFVSQACFAKASGRKEWGSFLTRAFAGWTDDELTKVGVKPSDVHRKVVNWAALAAEL